MIDGWNGLAEDDRVEVHIDNVWQGGSGTSIDQSRALLTVRVSGAMVVGTLSSASIERVVIAGYIGSRGQAGPDFDQNLAELVLACGDPGLLNAASRAAVLREAASDLRDPLGGSTCSRMSFGLGGVPSCRD